MRSGLEKSYRENKNTHFVFNNLFSENRTIYEIISKNIVETDRSQTTSQYGAYSLHAVLARLYARMRMHTPTRWGTYMHTCARMHTQTNM
jgi:predicted RNA polymerase sigma factor